MAMIFPAPSYITGQVTEVNETILTEIQKEYGDNTTAFQFNCYLDKRELTK